MRESIVRDPKLIIPIKVDEELGIQDLDELIEDLMSFEPETRHMRDNITYGIRDRSLYWWPTSLYTNTYNDGKLIWHKTKAAESLDEVKLILKEMMLKAIENHNLIGDV